MPHVTENLFDLNSISQIIFARQIVCICVFGGLKDGSASQAQAFEILEDSVSAYAVRQDDADGFRDIRFREAEE